MNEDDIYGKNPVEAITNITKFTDEEQECVNLLLRAYAASLQCLL